MKRFACSLVVLGLIAGQPMAQWWNPSVIEEVQERGVLRVGVGLPEPWSFCNEDGELIGFDIDVATKIAGDIGVEVEFVRTNWDYIIPALIAEEFDAIINDMWILPSRNLEVNFTAPYNTTGTYLVANIAGTPDLATPASFNSPDIRLATRRGSAPVQFIANVFPNATVALFDTDSEVLEAVVAGDVDAAAAFGTTRLVWVAAHPDVLHLPFAEPFAFYLGAIAVRKGDLDTLNFFDGWIAANEADGWLEQRRQYWFETLNRADQAATDPATIAACEASFR